MDAISLGTVPRTHGEVWAVDLFAWAYDALATAGTWRHQDRPADVEHAPRVILWRDGVRDAAGWATGDLLGEMERELSAASDQAAVLLQIAVAIDRAFLGVRLNRPYPPSGWSAYEAVLDEWHKKGSLERSINGLVLRKGAQWKSGRALAHYFSELTRVEPTTALRVNVRTHEAVSSLGNLVREQGRIAEIRVAFIPMLDNMEDLDFSTAERGRTHLFGVELRPETQDRRIAEMGAFVENLEAEGINVAFFPETTATPQTCKALQDALIANYARSIGLDRLPSLRLAVIGISSTRLNEVVVLGADGLELIRQPKTHPWCLDASQQRRYGLTQAFGGVDREEDIDGSDSLTLLDDPGLGRIVVLICEDLARGDTAWHLTTSSTPTIVLTPLCDASLQKRRWAFTSALGVAQEPGALVLVANSFVLADREHRYRYGASSGVKSAGIGIVCHPTDRNQTQIVSGRPGGAGYQARRVRWLQASH